jgi:hypothetical protein
MVGTEVPPGTRFVWEQAESRLDAQMRHADALDTKAGVLVGLHALAAGLIATTAGHFHGSARSVLAAVIVGLVFSGGLAMAAFGTRRYDRRPAPVEMWRFGEWQEDEIAVIALVAAISAIVGVVRG